MGEAPNPSQETFLQSLLNHSNPCHPIANNAIYTPQHPSYSSVLQAYIRNLRFNTSKTPKPLFILTAMHESHVQAAVLSAKTHGLQMKIRSGGHDYEGSSYVSSDVPFFILDMCNLRSIDIDIENETAWVQTGATLGELFYRIAEKSETHGFPAGVCPTVGVGGHLIGAGYGNLMRKYGLSVDNVIDAKIVNVDGTILDRKSMGEDLFWAIRGSGASFGVVLAYKINLVRVPRVVTVFRVERTIEQNVTDIVYQWQHAAPEIDEDLFIRLVIDVIRNDGTREKTVRGTFIALFLGDSERLLPIMKESFPELGLMKPDCIEMSWIESVLFWTNFPVGTPTEVCLSREPQSLVHLKRKSDYVQEPISKQDLEGIWKKMMELEVPAMGFNPYGGKMKEIPETEAPFPHRAGNLWKIQYQINWTEEGEEAANYHLELARELYDYMTPFVSKNPRAAFLNYKDLDLGINNHGKQSYEEGIVYGMKYFKNNFDRLVQIKTKVDPSNFFRHEQSVPIFPNY
ncbi:berberine bridge enzyme-like 8 [Mercurialis annua]|uniref:berberine bridge enzyme-like 8 n=1 Tax=Mercurialis annua TaxID=3986 RepID=UPI00215EA29E|nr:berberine bridge enzyme-like 8 [Mercurialis annua]